MKSPWVLVLLVILVALSAYLNLPTAPVDTPSPTPQVASPPPPAAHEIAIDQLPDEARATLQLITEGGPFPYPKDGTTFGNRERLLPRRERGYYHEYTVETPGSSDRGARRIVTGSQGEHYYTDDHYQSFRRIQER